MQRLAVLLVPPSFLRVLPHYFSVMADSASEAPLAAQGRRAIALSLSTTAVKSGIYETCQRERNIAWTTPILVEICIGLEINGYLPAEF